MVVHANSGHYCFDKITLIVRIVHVTIIMIESL